MTLLKEFFKEGLLPERLVTNPGPNDSHLPKINADMPQDTSQSTDKPGENPTNADDVKPANHDSAMTAASSSMEAATNILSHMQECATNQSEDNKQKLQTIHESAKQLLAELKAMGNTDANAHPSLPQKNDSMNNSPVQNQGQAPMPQNTDNRMTSPTAAQGQVSSKQHRGRVTESMSLAVMDLFDHAFSEAGKDMLKIKNVNAQAYGNNLGRYSALEIVKALNLKTSNDPNWKLYDDFKKGFVTAMNSVS